MADTFQMHGYGCLRVHKIAGIYIMQNSMVRGRGEMASREKRKLGVRGKKKKKGKEKRMKITSKMGKNSLKMHLFGL